jgi:predicted RNA-binding Zn-ribbon protein involved in translation (DUF1610 family)
VVTSKEKGTWIQCTQCGKIYHIKEAVPIDKLYTDAECPKCGNLKAINCGDKEEDIILYCDSYLDERFYRY